MSGGAVIPKGYKMTECGVVPEDWAITKIRSVCTLINGRGFKPFEWKTDGLPIIRIQNLNGSDEYNYYQGTYDKKLEVEPEQLLFAWSGSRGTSFGPHIWNGSLGLLNYHTWKVKVDESRINNDFFFFALKKLTSFIEDNAHGASALVHTQKWEMEGFDFPLPPTKAEQTAIATALSDADELIDSLSRLIEKKRAIKQGAMQELLTGKRRLPGFKGKWEEWPIIQLAQNIIDYRGRTPKKIGMEWGNGNILALSAGNVKMGYIDFEAEAYYGSNELYFKWMQNGEPRKGDIAFTLEAPLGNVALIPDNRRYILSQRTILLQFNGDKVDSRFALYIFMASNFQSRLKDEATGSTAQGIKRKSFEKLTIAVPQSINEQNAIATILTDLDTELFTLTTKLSKARTIKSGMMQELLTGRVRLK